MKSGYRDVDYRELIEETSIPEPNSGCWLWIGSWTDAGYGRAWVDGKHWRAHRLSHLAFRGSLSDDELIMHTCDNRCCVNPEHLQAGTMADNIQDAVRKGRILRGSKNRSAVLHETQIAEIRSKLLLGQTRADIGAEYGVHPTTIGYIARGKTWKSL